jgi:hypothetical protein
MGFDGLADRVFLAKTRGDCSMKKLLLLALLLLPCAANAQTGFSDTSIFTGVPAVSSCGSGTLAAGSTDTRGQITGVTAATACTITFSTPKKAGNMCNPPSGSVALVAPLLTSLSTTAVTFGMTAFTGTLYYNCP